MTIIKKQQLIGPCKDCYQLDKFTNEIQQFTKGGLKRHKKYCKGKKNTDAICKNCKKTKDKHHPTVYGPNTRCKIEGVKIYFDEDHWDNETTLDELLANSKESYGECKCGLGYMCWDCYTTKKQTKKNKKKYDTIFNAIYNSYSETQKLAYPRIRSERLALRVYKALKEIDV